LEAAGSPLWDLHLKRLKSAWYDLWREMRYPRADPYGVTVSTYAAFRTSSEFIGTAFWSRNHEREVAYNTNTLDEVKVIAALRALEYSKEERAAIARDLPYAKDACQRLPLLWLLTVLDGQKIYAWCRRHVPNSELNGAGGLDPKVAAWFVPSNLGSTCFWEPSQEEMKKDLIGIRDYVLHPDGGRKLVTSVGKELGKPGIPLQQLMAGDRVGDDRLEHELADWTATNTCSWPLF
jgi:hypothetical protein